MNLRRIENFVRHRSVCLLGSTDPQKYPNIRAMLKPRKMIGLKHFYFSTNTSSHKVKQFRGNPKACLYFYRKGLFCYTGVMLKGEVRILTDQPSKDETWQKGDQKYYRLGPTDPDYCVLKFTAKTAHYYRNLKTAEFKVR